MELLSLECPQCGAHLPPRDPMGQIQCGYCGASFQAPQARAARNASGQAVDPQQLARMIAQEMAAQQRSAAPPQPHYGPPPGQTPASPYGPHSHQVHQQAASGARRMSWVITLFVLIGTCIPAGIGLVTSGALSGVEGLGDLAAAATNERLLFDKATSPPARVKIGDKPAVIVRTRVVHPEDKLFIDAYDAGSVQLLWRVGPLGTYTAGYQSTHFAAVGDKVVISHADSKLTIHDLQTGEQVQSLAMTDAAEQLCPAPAGKDEGHVFVRKVDEKHLMLDVEEGKLEERKKEPRWCPTDTWREGLSEPGYAPPESAPKIDGFKTEFVRLDGDLGVAAGVKHPGTAIPKVAGFDRRTKKVNWEGDVYAVDRTSLRANSMEYGALAGGRFSTVYGSGNDAWHVTSFDAKTGDRLWHVTLRPIFAVDSINGVYASETQVFVIRTSSMEIFDASNGTLLGVIGTETYD